MELDFDQARWSIDDEGLWLSLRVTFPAMARRFVASMKDRMYTAKLVEKRKKRSLDANAYCWVLLSKLSEELSRYGTVISPEDIYRNLIPHVGGNSKILPIREDAIEEWKAIWGSGRTGWVCEDIGECRTLPGYHNIICYYGSSTYDTEQMSRLIDLIIQECRQLGIETMTPMELAALKSRWEDAQEDKSA